MISLVVTQALAWEQNVADWSGNTAPVEEPLLLNPTSFTAAGLDPDEVEATYQQALDVWNSESGADFYLEYGGRSISTVRGDGDNDVNVTFFGGSTFSAGIAITTWGYFDDTVNDCDTEFHDENLYGALDWHVGEEDAPDGVFDLQHTMTHETGHCLGLGHSADDDAIMRSFTTDGTGEGDRHLRPDDIAGVQAIYGQVAPELVTHDAILGDTAFEGDTVRIDLPIENTGDGTAWFVTASVDGEDPYELGSIGADTPVGARVGPNVYALSFPWSVTCDGGFDVVLADRIGTTWDFAVPVECVPLDTTEPPGGCGCASPNGSSSLGLLGLVALSVLGQRHQRRVRVEANPRIAVGAQARE